MQKNKIPLRFSSIVMYREIFLHILNKLKVKNRIVLSRLSAKKMKNAFIEMNRRER